MQSALRPSAICRGVYRKAVSQIKRRSDGSIMPNDS
jgi:hypothetical protein